MTSSTFTVTSSPVPLKAGGRRSRALEGAAVRAEPKGPSQNRSLDTTERGDGCWGERGARGLSAVGSPLPATLWSSAPTPASARPLAHLAAPPPQLCSPNASLRYAEQGQWVRGGVNTCRARTGNTCEAVSTPPPPRLQTTHLHRTSNFIPHVRLADEESERCPLGAGRAEASGVRA